MPTYGDRKYDGEALDAQSTQLQPAPSLDSKMQRNSAGAAVTWRSIVEAGLHWIVGFVSYGVVVGTVCYGTVCYGMGNITNMQQCSAVQMLDHIGLGLLLINALDKWVGKLTPPPTQANKQQNNKITM